MADLEKLNAPSVPPQQIEERKRARLKVAEYAVRCSASRIGQREWCGIYLDMLALWPEQDSEYVPTILSRGRLTNSTMVRVRDAAGRRKTVQ